MRDLYKEIPKTSVNWSDPLIDVAKQWMDGYFETQTFAIKIVCRFQIARFMAITGWSLSVILAICLGLKS